MGELICNIMKIFHATFWSYERKPADILLTGMEKVPREQTILHVYLFMHLSHYNQLQL